MMHFTSFTVHVVIRQAIQHTPPPGTPECFVPLPLISSYKTDKSSWHSGDSWPESFYDGMTDAQRAVLEPPYHTGRADIGRPFLNDDGTFGGGVLAKHGKLHSKPPPALSASKL